MRIQFVRDNKPPLSREDVKYWLKAFNRTLKVGVELEFNLSYKPDMCKGDNPRCSCIHLSKCGDACLKLEECKTFKAHFNCANYNEKCDISKCKDCENHKFYCDPKTCIEFISKCLFCPDIDKGCDKCDRRYELKYDPPAVRRQLTFELHPTNNWGKFGKFGIAQVVKDGSLLGNGGVEITTVGQYTDFFKLCRTIKRITDSVRKYGAYVNERTSVHIHILTGHYKNHINKVEGHSCSIRTNELERNIPQIVFANFWQLCRKYQNAITWLGMGLPNPNHRTRWEKFRISILPFDAVFKNVGSLIEEVINAAASVGRNDYAFVNPINCVINSDNNLSVFHVELRSLDNLFCPSIIAAFACLLHAMLLKSVELSQYGTIRIDPDELASLNEDKEKILNNCPHGWDPGEIGRVSITNIDNSLMDKLCLQSIELLTLVKRHLSKFGNSPFNILKKLAEKPVSYYLEEGWDHRVIESEFQEEIEIVRENGPSDQELEIQKIIDLGEIINCTSLEEWINKAYELLKIKKVRKTYLRKVVKTKMKSNEWEWSEKIGSII